MSHIRCILTVGTMTYFGAGVYAFLKSWHDIRGHEIPTKVQKSPRWQQVQWMADHLTVKHTLQLFREPKRIKEEHSRYIQGLQAKGLGTRRIRGMTLQKKINFFGDDPLPTAPPLNWKIPTVTTPRIRRTALAGGWR